MGLIKWIKKGINKFKNSKFGKGVIKVAKGVGKGVKWFWKNGLKIANAVNQSPLGGVLNGMTKGAFGVGLNLANTADSIGGQVGENIKGFVKGAEDLVKPGGDKTAALTQMHDTGQELAGNVSKISGLFNRFKNMPAGAKRIVVGPGGYPTGGKTAVMPPGSYGAKKIAGMPAGGLAPPPPVRTLIP